MRKKRRRKIEWKECKVKKMKYVNMKWFCVFIGAENGHYVLTNCWHFPLKCGHQVWPCFAVVRVVSWVMWRHYHFHKKRRTLPALSEYVYNLHLRSKSSGWSKIHQWQPAQPLSWSRCWMLNCSYQLLKSLKRCWKRPKGSSWYGSADGATLLAGWCFEERLKSWLHCWGYSWRRGKSRVLLTAEVYLPVEQSSSWWPLGNDGSHRKIPSSCGCEAVPCTALVVAGPEKDQPQWICFYLQEYKFLLYIIFTEMQSKLQPNSVFAEYGQRVIFLQNFYLIMLRKMLRLLSIV